MIKMEEPKKYWLIRHYEGNSIIAEHKFPFGYMKEGRIKILLQMLTMKYSITDEEAISSFFTKCSNAHSNHLKVNNSIHPYHFSCGENPHFVARVVEEKMSI